MKCRFCGEETDIPFLDLSSAPPSNSFLSAEQLDQPEIYYPLKVLICPNCLLVQIDEYKKNSEIFNDQYAYFSSYSKSWLTHCKKYVTMIVEAEKLNKDSLIIEIASNDGYLLQFFKEMGLSCQGIEPSANTANAAKQKGIETIIDFFSSKLAKRLSYKRKPNLIIGNNVLAHVPDINDFVKGLKILLNDSGIITMEFPHIQQLISDNQFDTIYHEHYSYFSLYTAARIFESQGLKIFDAESIQTHGGSLRIYAAHQANTQKCQSDRFLEILSVERSKGLHNLKGYRNFQKQADGIKHNFLTFLLEEKRKGKKIAAYGAAAKGNTLLNYCGVKPDLINFVVDASPHKQGMFLPGNRIPVVNEKAIKKFKPDVIVILPWNLKDEIITQLDYAREWNATFTIAVPELQIIH